MRKSNRRGNVSSDLIISKFSVTISFENIIIFLGVILTNPLLQRNDTVNVY
jgi:hypothetical protein